MMKTRHYTIPMALLLLMAVASQSCSSDKQEDTQNVEAHNLYRELKETYRIYADSINATSDSAQIDSMVMRLDNRLRKIYARYPADLDIHISESENDTLWSITKRIAEARNRVARPAVVDSLATDSVDRTDGTGDSLPEKPEVLTKQER